VGEYLVGGFYGVATRCVGCGDELLKEGGVADWCGGGGFDV
jgi:hypothetical protein